MPYISMTAILWGLWRSYALHNCTSGGRAIVSEATNINFCTYDLLQPHLKRAHLLSPASLTAINTPVDIATELIGVSLGLSGCLLHHTIAKYQPGIATTGHNTAAATWLGCVRTEDSLEQTIQRAKDLQNEITLPNNQPIKIHSSPGNNNLRIVNKNLSVMIK